MVKNKYKMQIGKLTCILRFKEGMSIRSISHIIKQIYGFNYSTGYISQFCQQVGKKAKAKMETINDVYQSNVKMIIADETFPITQESGTTNLGVIVDEYGVIRNLKAIIQRKIDLKILFSSTISGYCNPKYFMSDYDKTYPGVIKDVKEKIIIMKDFVHTLRKLYRNAATAINQVKVKGIEELTQKKQKQITQLKKKLLRKRLYQVLYKIKKGFDSRYASVGTFYIEGGLEELKELSETFPSLANYYSQVEKFITKYIDVWAMQMEKGAKVGIPTTSNLIESKNSILKRFSKRLKYFKTNENMEYFFLAVALMENFDIKTRGANKGTSAFMRAQLDFEELGTTNFFDAIDLESIVLGESQSQFKAKSKAKENKEKNEDQKMAA